MSKDVQTRNENNSDEEWVRIESNDGYSFLVKRKIINTSGTLRDMLAAENTFVEATSKTCTMEERASLVEKSLEYMAFNKAYENTPPKEEIPVNEFMERIPPEVALELLFLADYLDV